MIAEAERLRDKDKQATDRVEALNELQKKLSLLRAQTNDPAISSRLSPSQLRSMCTSLDEVDGWLAMNNESSKEDYEVKMEDLDAACKPLMQVQSYFLLVYLVLFLSTSFLFSGRLRICFVLQAAIDRATQMDL